MCLIRRKKYGILTEFINEFDHLETDNYGQTVCDVLSYFYTDYSLYERLILGKKADVWLSLMDVGGLIDDCWIIIVEFVFGPEGFWMTLIDPRAGSWGWVEEFDVFSE